MAPGRGCEYELIDRMLDYRAAGPADVAIPGDALADILSELLSLAQTTDDLLDHCQDWKARAEAWEAQVAYLLHLVEHLQRIVSYLEGDGDDRDSLALRIEADNLVLFSPDTLSAIADLLSVVATDAEDG